MTKKEAESIIVKKFEETFLGVTLIWYTFLSENSIDSFNILTYSFIRALTRAKMCNLAEGIFSRLSKEK